MSRPRKNTSVDFVGTRAGAAFVALAMALVAWPSAYAMDCSQLAGRVSPEAAPGADPCEFADSPVPMACDSSYSDECCCIAASTPFPAPVQARAIAMRTQLTNTTSIDAPMAHGWYVLPQIAPTAPNAEISLHLHRPPLHLRHRSLLI